MVKVRTVLRLIREHLGLVSNVLAVLRAANNYVAALKCNTRINLAITNDGFHVISQTDTMLEPVVPVVEDVKVITSPGFTAM